VQVCVRFRAPSAHHTGSAAHLRTLIVRVLIWAGRGAAASKTATATAAELQLANDGPLRAKTTNSADEECGPAGWLAARTGARLRP
jgi:hypothetical protein